MWAGEMMFCIQRDGRDGFPAAGDNLTGAPCTSGISLRAGQRKRQITERDRRAMTDDGDMMATLAEFFLKVFFRRGEKGGGGGEGEREEQTPQGWVGIIRN